MHHSTVMLLPQTLHSQHQGTLALQKLTINTGSSVVTRDTCYQYTSNMIWKRGHHHEAEEKEIQSVKVLPLLLRSNSSTWGKTTLDGWAAGSK